MRLLHVSGEYPPDVGGVGDYTERLRGALRERGWDSAVLSRRQVGRWDARSLAWLLRAAPREGLIHLQYQAAAYDLLGDVCVMPTVLRVLRPSVRVATTFHDARAPYLFPKAGSLRLAALRWLARTSDAVIAADERDLDLLAVPSSRRYQVPIGSNLACEAPPGYDRQAFRARLGLATETLGIVYFGLLNASKGLDVLLDAFELLVRRGGRVGLLLLGGLAGASDPTDRLTAARVRERVDRLGEHVIRVGWLPARELSAHLLAGDVALLPYADGASPRRGSLLACAEHGLPIVSTLPASRAVADAVHAVSADAPSLAEAVQQVAHDPALAARLREASRALTARTAWPRIADAHIQIYRSLLLTSPRRKGSSCSRLYS